MIEVIESALQKAAGEGMDEFIQVFTDKYKEVIGGELTADTMPLLTGEQHSLLAYQIFRDEIMVGGFCQLIQNGYGGYIFDNPFAKVMRLWGADEFSKLIYKAKKIFDANRKDLEKERTDDEFMAMYEQYEAFDELEEVYLEMEEQVTALIASYVDEHLELFAKIIKYTFPLLLNVADQPTYFMALKDASELVKMYPAISSATFIPSIAAEVIPPA